MTEQRWRYGSPRLSMLKRVDTVGNSSASDARCAASSAEMPVTEVLTDSSDDKSSISVINNLSALAR